MNRQPSDTAAHAGSGSQQGRTHLALAAGNQQGMPEVALVSKHIARTENTRHIFIFNQHIRCFCPCHDIRMQSDRQYFPSADIRSILGQYHGELRKFERECHIGLNNAIRIILPIIFSKKSRRDIDRNDRRIRLVNIIDDGRISAAQRPVQSGTEQPVDHHIMFRKYGGRKIFDHFVQKYFPIRK